jgi:hypothetical protein
MCLDDRRNRDPPPPGESSAVIGVLNIRWWALPGFSTASKGPAIDIFCPDDSNFGSGRTKRTLVDETYGCTIPLSFASIRERCITES